VGPVKLPLSLPPSPDRPFDVVAFGENSVDYVARGAMASAAGEKRRLSHFEILPGGQSTTAAIAAARLGVKARYVGLVGDDEWGELTRRTLAAAGVDPCTLKVTGARSRAAVVLVDDDTGERTILEYRDDGLIAAEPLVRVEEVLAGRLLLLDGTAMRLATSLAAQARTVGIRTIVDVDVVRPDLPALLGEIDVIVVPKPFLAAWTGIASPGAALRALASQFRPALAVVTLGAEGSLAVSGSLEIRTPAYRVAVEDTTGAGDAFRGGLAGAWIRLGDPPDLSQLLRCANATAALNCRGAGAQGGLPTWTEVMALVTGSGDDQSN
jgi:sugar/nucleoside kinase (ribokinase family)